MAQQPTTPTTPHAGISVAARLPHLGLFTLGGLVYAVSALNGDLSNILSVFMTIVPVVSGLIHLIHVESQNVKAGWAKGQAATPTDIIGQLVALGASSQADTAAITNAVNAIKTAFKTS